ncbi:MAG: NADH-quinone oxidoreductase subunit H [Elusimicrobiota bacterium]
MDTILAIIQTLVLISIAPLLSGVIRKIKNTLRMRQGAPVLQPYYNLSKLFIKDDTFSTTSSWILRITPYIVLGSTITALLLVPSIIRGISLEYTGDFITLIFVLALGRFFLALAGLDTGSAFGGMGSSREMFISAFVEPVALASIFTICLSCGSTNLNIVSTLVQMRISTVIAAAALFVITIAETSRLPVDNQETHLELTMVHEAMILEYSGRSLAMIELAAHIKQILFFTLISLLFFPPGILEGSGLWFYAADAAMYITKLAALALIMSVLEIMIAKLRLFRVPDLLVFSFVLSCIAVVITSLGY